MSYKTAFEREEVQHKKKPGMEAMPWRRSHQIAKGGERKADEPTAKKHMSTAQQYYAKSNLWFISQLAITSPEK